MVARTARQKANDAAAAAAAEPAASNGAPLQPPATNPKKRSASRSPSPLPSPYPEGTQVSPTEEGSSQHGSQDSHPSEGSVKKRPRTEKKVKEPGVPVRASTRIPKVAPPPVKAQASKTSVTAKAKAAAAAAAAKVAKPPPKVVAPKAPVITFNKLPGTPPIVRPSRQLFIFGTGDMGQFGLGPDSLGEIKRPRLHLWFDDAVKSGKLGSEPGAGVEHVAAGGMHNLVVDEAGRVWSWGINDGAALGRITAGVKDPQTDEVIDSEILETQPMVVQKLVDEGFRAVFVAAGDSISIALSDKGELRAWGSFRSSEGLLGFDGVEGSAKLQYEPIPISHLAKQRFVSAACGGDHVIALTVDGTVYAWGDARQGAIGRRVSERRIAHGLDPDRLALRKIVHVASGLWHSFAIDADGVVYGWGLNSMGQVGIDDESYFDLENTKSRTLEDHIPQPTIVDVLHPKNLGHGRKVVSISGGEHHTIFLLSDGSVYACGRNDSAQLGLAADHPAIAAFKALKELHPTTTTDCIPYPVQVFFPPTPISDEPEDNDPPLGTYEEASKLTPNGGPRTPILQINAGTRHNLAVSCDGVVYAWGYGSQYQLGMGEVDQKDVPGRVKSKAIADFHLDTAYAGGQHCIIVGRRKHAAADAS